MRTSQSSARPMMAGLPSISKVFSPNTPAL